jgi:hypothetical protein
MGGHGLFCQVARYRAFSRQLSQGGYAGILICYILTRMEILDMGRKSLAIVALFALLMASTPALAHALSDSELPACCNNAYCPMRHGQVRDTQKDKHICGMTNKLLRDGCLLRTCDATPNRAVGIAPFVLASPLAIFYEATVQDAPLLPARFFPFTVSIPTTPPPRTLPS